MPTKNKNKKGNKNKNPNKNNNDLTVNGGNKSDIKVQTPSEQVLSLYFILHLA